MFYCDPCRRDNRWPESAFKSIGPCEVCGRRRTCSEVSSKSLSRVPPPLLDIDGLPSDADYNTDPLVA